MPWIRAGIATIVRVPDHDLQMKHSQSANFDSVERFTSGDYIRIDLHSLNNRPLNNLLGCARMG